MQERLNKGEFNKATTRVLHFKKNPEAAALAKAEQSRNSKLEAENNALKSQLQKLEGQSAQPASVNSAVQEAQITLLQHEVQCISLQVCTGLSPVDECLTRDACGHCISACCTQRQHMLQLMMLPVAHLA